MYVVISLIALGASFLTLFSGFGLGTILMPVFAIFFSIEAAVAMTAVVKEQSVDSLEAYQDIRALSAQRF